MVWTTVSRFYTPPEPNSESHLKMPPDTKKTKHNFCVPAVRFWGCNFFQRHIHGHCGHADTAHRRIPPKFSQSFLFKNPIHRFNSRKPSDFSANRRICRALDSQYSDAINNSGFTPRAETFTWICRAFKSSQRNLEFWVVWETKVVLRMLFEQQD